MPATEEEAGCTDLGHGAHPAEGNGRIGNPALDRSGRPVLTFHVLGQAGVGDAEPLDYFRRKD
ncbi:hypothetical protein GCM10009680_05840 [Streptomyces yatensis]|uniref:Uncharacterized protein n=1 Tax=Streptomyces yatensis TaxID=155177 RepID=A0ABP4SB65_9ACTN